MNHINQTYDESLYDGKRTLWCCLSCGMPFSYPNDYIGLNSNITDSVVHITHSIGNSIKDLSMPYNQWDKKDCNVFPMELDEVYTAPGMAFFSGNSTGFTLQLTELKEMIGTKKSGRIYNDNESILICYGCSSIQNNAIDIKRSMKIIAPAKDNRIGESGMSILTLRQLFIRSSHVSTLIYLSRKEGISESRRWRSECLTR